MEYDLIKATNNDIDFIKKAKLYNILKYAHDLTEKDILNINNYVEKSLLVEMSNFKIIVYDNQKIGCLLVTEKKDSITLDEIYLEEEYRNKKIGTNIITNILKSNPLVYLWVYKENTKAISLYKKMKFKVINETETRYYMGYSK